jgi:hypothetical protein
LATRLGFGGRFGVMLGGLCAFAGTGDRRAANANCLQQQEKMAGTDRFTKVTDITLTALERI